MKIRLQGQIRNIQTENLSAPSNFLLIVANACTYQSL